MEIKGKYNYSGIYCLKNTIDDKCYVGSAQKLNYRLWNHKHKLIKGNHANNILQNFVNKYGIESIYFEIIEPVEIDKLIEREQHYIDALKPEFNILLKAGSSTGTIMSEEQKVVKIGGKQFLNSANIIKELRIHVLTTPIKSLQPLLIIIIQFVWRT